MNLSVQATRPISDCRIAYLAGYFDGEGCIHVGRMQGTFYLRIAVASGDRETVCLFGELLGGKVKRAWTTKNGRKVYRWLANNANALRCLRILLPYLLAKREQAVLVLESGWEACARFRHGLPQDQRDIREALHRSLRTAKLPCV